MLDSYFAGRVQEMWELSRITLRFMPDIDPAQAEASFAQVEEQILVARNHAWIPVIEAAAADNNRMVVAVGAAHLPGVNGVLQLMENAGWTITPY